MRHLAKLGALISSSPSWRPFRPVPPTCTQAEKSTAAVAALASYQKKIPKERAAYFRKHRSAKLRKAFVKKQQAKLKRLRDAAALRPPLAPGPRLPRPRRPPRPSRRR